MTDKTSKILSRTEDPDGVKALDASFAEAHVFREKAVKHLQDKWNKIQSKQVKDIAYDSASWPHKQAHCNGKLLMIEELLTEVFNVKGK